MYKPVRPKSAKGKTRAARTTVHQQESSFSREPKGATSSQSAVESTTRRSTITSSYATSSSNSLQTGQSRSFDSSSSQQQKLVADTKSPASPVVNFPEISRPVSSLSKYRILPSISGANTPVGEGANSPEADVDFLTEQAQQMILDSTLEMRNKNSVSSSISSTNKRKVIKGDIESEYKRLKVFQTESVFASSGKPLIKEHPQPRVPREPGPDEKRLLLALKLPDGSRVERYFPPNTKLNNVLAFSHSQYPILPMSQLNIYMMEKIPKRLLEELHLTLEEADIQNRTVLYIEEKDDDA